MTDYHRIPYVNIDRQRLQTEMNRRSAYYSNVVIWTLLFSLPLFWLLDVLFLNENWVFLGVLRLISFGASYFFYTFGNKRRWSVILIQNLVVGVNLFLVSLICGIVQLNNALPYFLLSSVVVLLINNTLFWKPIYAQFHVGISIAVILLTFSLVNTSSTYTRLLLNGGGAYFLVAGFSCFLAYNRYNQLKRETEKNLIIEESNKRMLDQNEQINDQHHQIEAANRRLKELSDYRQNTLNIMIHDLKNFIGSNQISIDLINRKSGNLTTDQKEILSYITMGNEKLHYLSQKLADSAEADTGKIEYRMEEFDAIIEVEKAAISLVDAASIKQINLQLHLTPAQVVIRVDKIFLRHILFKLLSNVIRYVPKGSTISIHAAEVEGDCIIEFVSKSVPIGMEKLDEYFNRLADPNQSDAAMGHSGMGFAIASQLSQNMGGQLSYESNPVVGNYFKLKFKLA